MSRAAVLALLALLAGCRHATGPGAPGADDASAAPASETWGARLTATDGGRPTVSVEAPYLARFADSAEVALGPAPGTDSGRVRVRLFDDAGAVRASVESARARLHESDRRLVAEGRVVATLPSARVEAPRLTTAGESFTASGGATVQLSGETSARVRAATVSGTGSRVEASGGVTVESGGRTLRADRVVMDGDRLSAPGAFAFDGPGERVRGVDLSASRDLSRYSFRRATGQIEVRE